MTFSHECIVCIVNTGFSDAVMDAAREFGARGGTVIHGRGTASREAERFFGISITPDKELVLILVPHDLTDQILHALYRAVGLKTPGQGIAFSLPVDQVVGLSTLTFDGDGTGKPTDGSLPEPTEKD
ncbi:MAG: P-II family nitrogen regulator [Clostridia bacterium]|nr:P-II family nitrogen regulator [Clostridia bacterium]